MSPGIRPAIRVPRPPLAAMVRGPSGPDNDMGEIPDGFKHFHYADIYFAENKIMIHYRVNSPEGGESPRWRVFPIDWLYAAIGAETVSRDPRKVDQ